MTTVTLDRHEGHAYSYDVVDLGFNYRMSELNAALGLVQLEDLASRNVLRKRLVDRYRAQLSAIDGLFIPFSSHCGEATHHLMPVLLPEHVERTRVMDGLREAGIQTSIHYRPVDTFTAFRNRGLGPCEHLTLTREIGERQLTLPLYPSLDPARGRLRVRRHTGRLAQRMKICFLGWGDHIHVERWAACFACMGHDVSVISVTGRGLLPSRREAVRPRARKTWRAMEDTETSVAPRPN